MNKNIKNWAIEALDYTSYFSMAFCKPLPKKKKKGRAKIEK